MSAICGPSARAQTQKKFDVLATNLRSLKVIAADIIAQQNKLYDALGKAEHLIVDIMAVDDTPEINALLNRASRMFQLCRQMEVGSFKLETDRAVDNAWQRLP